MKRSMKAFIPVTVAMVVASAAVSDPMTDSMANDIGAGAGGHVVLTYYDWDDARDIYLTTYVVGVLDTSGRVMGQDRWRDDPDEGMTYLDGAQYGEPWDYSVWYGNQPNANWSGPGGGVYAGGPFNNVLGQYLVPDCFAAGDCNETMFP